VPQTVDPPAVLALIAEPRRWRLLAELSRSDRRVGELCELIGEPQNLVSYHLGALRRAGIVSRRRSSSDGRDVYYRVDLERCRVLLAAVGKALHPGLRSAPPAPDPLASSGGRRPRVLFLCTGNSARSQIAEALLEHRSAGAIAARSAGSDPKPLHPNTVRVLADRGIDVSGRPTRHLRQFTRSRFDRVITLCDKVREVCPEFPGRPATVHWSTPDPSASDGTDAEALPAFEALADELEVRVSLLIAELTTPWPERTNHVG
jgi:protein-tyrosine-phosphatase/DNA-binding HxlR family transcriptional regulator